MFSVHPKSVRTVKVAFTLKYIEENSVKPAHILPHINPQTPEISSERTPVLMSSSNARVYCCCSVVDLLSKWQDVLSL